MFFYIYSWQNFKFSNIQSSFELFECLDNALERKGKRLCAISKLCGTWGTSIIYNFIQTSFLKQMTFWAWFFSNNLITEWKILVHWNKWVVILEYTQVKNLK